MIIRDDYTSREEEDPLSSSNTKNRGTSILTWTWIETDYFVLICTTHNEKSPLENLGHQLRNPRVYETRCPKP